MLIVVAIIAILAAIAVPNFLQAQARAKVTRTIVDMRSIGIAIHAYAVDWNEPPRRSLVKINATGVLMVYTAAPNEPGLGSVWMGTLLTTPVAYITRIPVDHWNSEMVRLTSHSRWTRNVDISVLGSYIPSGSISGDGTKTWKEWWETDFIGPHGYTYPSGNFRFALYSAGPDLHWWTGNITVSGDEELFYDPTNGTISRGDLWYFEHVGNIPSYQ